MRTIAILAVLSVLALCVTVAVLATAMVAGR